ncbi:DUF4144 domain-containing protein [Shewanella sp. Isolate11]|uniref:DUF4144 domain-containing protein n=1 Tax=Shewanella sp. Isolate11 TaxID=2908530 RepID=UPI001EFDBDD1|nr:DUF4144 domain-containing protein [Shewanella sp. Isolate11]MCG9695677.1 DUF4144 domain-containing protein [Shewanella sp. Isolate11]
MLQWPVMIKHTDDDLLQLLDSPEQWRQEYEQLQANSLTIIDAEGLCYHWQQGEFVAAPRIPLEQLIAWLRVHASLNGHCCTAKLGANNIKQVFEILRYLEQE